MSSIIISIVAYRHKLVDIDDVIKSVSQYQKDLIIIDNSPTSDLQRQLRSCQQLKYIHNPSNPGFGAAHNIALKHALDLDIKYHLILNPDVSFDHNIISKLIKFMDENPNIGNVMPKVHYKDESIQYLCKLLPTPYDWIGRRFNPLKKMVEKRNEIFELRFSGYDKTMDVPYLSGCFMFLRVDALKKIGLFDERIFMYGEETDLCRRLINGGYRTVFYPEVSIVHEFQKGSHKSFRLTWIGIKSAIYYFNKWGWFFDKERTKINKETLQKLNYRK
jgi:GT2 family glycosyltransferase